MSSYDRKFEVLMPDLSMLYRESLEVADRALLDPESIAPPALIDGEFIELNSSNKAIRGADPTKLCYATIDDRGDHGVQASRKMSILRVGGYVANTIVYDPALVTLGAPVMQGDVTIGGLVRRGLIAHAGANLVLGYIVKLAATNGGLLRFQQTLV